MSRSAAGAELKKVAATVSKLIVLDPGHGGNDPGAVGNGLKEKALNLTISLATRDALKDYDCTVKMTRTKDVYVALSARAAMGKGAAIFVSQHNNAYSASSARGFETFANSGPLLSATLDYRDAIHDAICPHLKSLGVPNRGKKRYNHYITRAPACPTVLIEYLFVTNPTDATLLKKSAVLKELGRLTATGIVKALGLKKKKTASPKSSAPGGVLYRVQVGAYTQKANAEAMLARLKKAGFDAIIVTESAAPAAAPAPAKPAIKKGSKVKVKSGAKDYDGRTLASFVYNTVYDVIEIKGDRAVIGKGKAVTAAVNTKDLTLV